MPAQLAHGSVAGQRLRWRLGAAPLHRASFLGIEKVHQSIHEIHISPQKKPGCNIDQRIANYIGYMQNLSSWLTIIQKLINALTNPSIYSLAIKKNITRLSSHIFCTLYRGNFSRRASNHRPLASFCIFCFEFGIVSSNFLVI